jgi:type 1 glutamine amidotransferase
MAESARKPAAAWALCSRLLTFCLLLAPAGAQGAIRVLWLGGGNTSHDPAAMRDLLVPVFAGAGLQAEYKTNESVLQADSLSRYDVMFIYNAKKGKAADGTPDLTAAQEDALYAWVRAGHTLVGAHSANSSYLGNPRYLELFGGEYTVHGDTAAYRNISVAAPAHPAMQGVSPPPAAGDNAYWDEGREARFSKTDTVMLQRAKANGGQEPWTWVRPEGKGWVYYTSGGHDARAWSDANYQAGLIQALKWGAGTYATSLAGGEAPNPGPFPVAPALGSVDVTGAALPRPSPGVKARPSSRIRFPNRPSPDARPCPGAWR